MDIKFKDASYTYNNKTPFKKDVLTRLNLEIKMDKINGIIGKSGSGKTTLIEMIDMLLIPTSGHVKVGEHKIVLNHKIKDINKLRSKIGFVFASPEEQFFAQTVKEEIAFGIKSFNYKTKDIDKRISDSLKMVGLNDSYMLRNPGTLSNGEMRKVAIASVLAFNPKVLILDEPTVGLDDASKKNLIKIIRNLRNKYEKTIIIATHDVDTLHKIVDYVFVLSEGKVLLEGTKYDVFKQEELLKKHGVSVPLIMAFSNLVLAKKNIKLGYRDDVNDLIKDIYRYVK